MKIQKARKKTWKVKMSALLADTESHSPPRPTKASLRAAATKEWTLLNGRRPHTADDESARTKVAGFLCMISVLFN